MTALSASFRRPRIDSTNGVWLALGVTLIVGGILVATDGGSLFGQNSTVSLLQRAAGLGIVAVGQTFTILAGSLDLSVAYVISLTSLIAAETMANSDGRVLPAILAVLAVSAAIGLVNGLLITKLRINAFIATLGVGLLIKGYLEQGYAGPAGQVPVSFQHLGYDRFGPVPVAFVLFIGVAAVAWVVINRSRYGHHLIATGGDLDVARLSGVRTDLVLIRTHVICSICAGIAGLYLASRLGAGAPRVGAEGGYDLESIAAVVLGGTVLAGGRGGVAGTVGGVLLLAVIDGIFNQLAVDPFFKQVIRGVVIVAAVAIYALRLRRKGSA
ncbi:ribose transport system permease protein [Asanoa ferruginea]|uniref:Autoinducer 2 import system permease protein LsrD n=1 Tax=Asanoa ferruginea TaxID=53367 RepID=A0A3D9ZHL7_9ACTN|nr:ABC transporter permease [Asanoa ferruginea]REF96888.1 ribose transport system permease protein [Asanoa ferruginea]GIF49761.1 ribose ABC transporter permease [Asanoa ferruginea]